MPGCTATAEPWKIYCRDSAFAIADSIRKKIASQIKYWSDKLESFFFFFSGDGHEKIRLEPRAALRVPSARRKPQAEQVSSAVPEFYSSFNLCCTFISSPADPVTSARSREDHYFQKETSWPIVWALPAVSIFITHFPFVLLHLPIKVQRQEGRVVFHHFHELLPSR